jgi:hypothetical protein
MTFSLHAKLAFGIDLGSKNPSFADGVDGGVYGWAEDDPQNKIMEPVSYNDCTATILAVKGYVFAAKEGGPAVEIAPTTLCRVINVPEVEAFRAHLLAAGFDDVEPKWLLVSEL